MPAADNASRYQQSLECENFRRPGHSISTQTTGHPNTVT